MDVSKQNIANIYPLTPLQEGLLFHTLSQQDDAYVQQLSYLLKGVFDEQRFVAVWQLLIDRHETLRTVFRHTGADRPLQLVLKTHHPEVSHYDLRGFDEDGQRRRRIQIKLRDRRRGFKLERDSLMRFTLLYLADDLTEVIWSHHHIILDGWSLGILLSESTRLYQQLDCELPAAPSFALYVKWLEKHDRGPSLQYWQDYLQDYQTEIKLPYTAPYRESAVVERVRGAFKVPDTLYASMSRLCRQAQVSLNTLLQASWALLLARYNSCEDVVFGTTVAGRPSELAGIEHTVGLFINTLPVRVGLAAEQSVLELLQQVHQRSIASEAHHYAPLASIQAQHPLQGRLLSTHVTLENFPLDERFKALSSGDDGGLKVVANDIAERTHYPLDLQFLPSASGLKVQMAYSAEFQPDMHQAIQAHLCELWNQLTQAPDRTLGSVCLIDTAMQLRMIRHIQSEVKQFPFDSLLNRFEAHVRSLPMATALVHDQAQLSYGELNGYAGDLVNRLYASGLNPGDYIGLCFERSLEMVVALLAVLKAGMVYVPMDPALPQQRLRFMVEDAALKTVLTSVDKAAQLAAVSPQLQIVALNELRLTTSTAIGWRAKPDSPAYVIYTSGSTGRPKGVVVSHGNMARLFSAADDLFNFSDSDVWCLFHSYGFDFSVWELWGALRYGGRLVIVPYWVSRSPEDFHQLLHREQVTVLNQTPTAFKQLLDYDRNVDAKLDALRYVIFGGEALEYKQLEPWFDSYGERPELVNMYGITETTVHVTFKSIRPADSALKSSYIGRPLGDLAVYVLDPYGNLCASGVPGELFVGGAGVCLGYLNREDLSAQRFVKLPQLGEAVGLLYRTGDSGRCLENGELEYLGRLDQQVQFHGFRIELGEIEQALLEHGEVEQAVVILTENPQQQQIIVAYYGTRSGESLAAAELRELLARRLPAYMIPGLFVCLQQFPLTTNGKVNRQALPAAEFQLDEPMLTASTPKESVLSEAWRQVLSVDSVGVKDNFFARGGDSIQAIRVVSQLRKQGYAVEVQDIFRYPTIQELAPWLQQAAAKKQQRGTAAAVGLTPIQHWFFEQMPVQQHFNHTALLEAVDGQWQADLLQQTWDRLRQHHQVLCYGFVREGETYQPVLSDSPVCVQTVSLMAEPDVEAAMRAHADRQQRSFALEQPPLLRLVHYQCPAADRLLVIMHHLLIDGVSWRILLEDFSTLYQALAAGRADAELPLPTDAYAEWAGSLSAYSRQPGLLAELPYWQAQVSAAARPAQAPCRFEDARSLQIQLPPALSQPLLSGAGEAYQASVEELLLTALIPAFEAWNGATEVLVMLEGHGREPVVADLDVGRTVGWFTSLYPFLLGKIKGRDLGYQIKAVKDRLRKVPHKGIGYGLLRYLTPAKDKAGETLEFTPDLVFNYLGQFQRSDQNGLYRALTEDVGEAVAKQNLRPAALEFSAVVFDQQMQLEWRYDRHLFSEASVADLAARYSDSLTEIVAHCSQQTSPQLSASDLTYDGLSLDELDELLALPHKDVKDVYPLTPMQQGMLFHALQDPGATAYHEQMRFTLQGDLVAADYAAAWQTLVARHDVLRTIFVIDKTQTALQVVLRQVSADLLTDDWSELTDEYQQQRLEDYLAADLTERFTWTERPPLRMKLFKLSTRRWCLVWSFHHILLDGWSVGVLMEEMGRIYQSIRLGHEPELPAAPPFSEYLRWLSRQDTAAGMCFWQEYTAGYEETAALPECRSPFAQSSELTWSFPQGLAQRVRQAAADHQVTPNVLMQAAWGLLLARYCDRCDVVFASVVSGRPSEIQNVERMVGLMINAVPVRVRFEPGESVGALLKRLHEHNSASQAYQFLPISETQPARGAPDHLLVFENFHQTASAASTKSELSVADMRGREETNYDLTVVITPGETWRLTCLYNSGRYAGHYIAQVATHFFELLDALCGSSEAAVGTLQMLTAEEMLRLRQLSVGVRPKLPVDQSLATLFEETAKTHAARTALIDSANEYSYSQLNIQANRLAHRLITRGIRAGDVVAVVMPRNALRVVTVLALIKTGAAYLGIEADVPAARVAQLCSAAGARALINADGIPNDVDVPLTFDPAQEMLQPASEDNPQTAVSPAAMAYISYTSGSTGSPKGVCVSHQNVIRLVVNCDYAPIAPEDRLLQLAPLSFDASTLELWAALLNGASLAVLDVAQPSLSQLGDWLQRQRVSVVWLTAGLFHQMVDEQLDDLSTLRLLLAGGDVVSAAHVRRVVDRFPALTFINGYGPTENTTFSCCQRVDHGTVLTSRVPIGRAIAHSQAWVLDQQLRLQPPGAIGELYVGGAGVAYGYWRQSAQTAAVFMPHPYAETPGERLYRTGDLVSLRVDGEIEFIGRADRQFKLRGYRIEAQEIEAAIKQQQAVQEIMVDVLPDGQGDKALVAYVVVAPGSSFAPTEVIAELKASLPAYMVPDFWVEIERFPLNANGKVDKAKLPDPFQRDQPAESLSPRNDLEQTLLEIWQQVLGVDSFGVTDDFFLLGGHSLKATQVVSLLRKRLSLEVPLALIFAEPTIARLAAAVAKLTPADQAQQPVRLVKRDRSRRKVV